jgi:hypothetical protein
MRTFKLVLFSLVLVLGLTGISFGQETTGTIEGTVKDPSGAVVPGVSVTASGTGYSRTVTTDDAGFFRAPAGSARPLHGYYRGDFGLW